MYSDVNESQEKSSSEFTINLLEKKPKKREYMEVFETPYHSQVIFDE